jgi:hypothetical protein
MNAPATHLTPPRIGQPWPAQGGIYAGLVPGADGGPDEHLILGPDLPPQRLTWQAALDWATALRTGGFSDWRVPTRDESAQLYATVRDQIETGYWYWTSTQYSRDVAWSQSFRDGGQVTFVKKFEARARAVRRFSVESLDHFEGGIAVQVGQLRRLANAMTSAADQLECAQQRERIDAEA